MSYNFLKGILIAFFFFLFTNCKLKTLILIYSLYRFHLMNLKISFINNLLIFYFYIVLKNVFNIIIIFCSRNF